MTVNLPLNPRWANAKLQSATPAEGLPATVLQQLNPLRRTLEQPTPQVDAFLERVRAERNQEASLPNGEESASQRLTAMAGRLLSAGSSVTPSQMRQLLAMRSFGLQAVSVVRWLAELPYTASDSLASGLIEPLQAFLNASTLVAMDFMGRLLDAPVEAAREVDASGSTTQRDLRPGQVVLHQRSSGEWVRAVVVRAKSDGAFELGSRAPGGRWTYETVLPEQVWANGRFQLGDYVAAMDLSAVSQDYPTRAEVWFDDHDADGLAAYAREANSERTFALTGAEVRRLSELQAVSLEGDTEVLVRPNALQGSPQLEATFAGILEGAERKRVHDAEPRATDGSYEVSVSRQEQTLEGPLRLQTSSHEASLYTDLGLDPNKYAHNEDAGLMLSFRCGQDEVLLCLAVDEAGGGGQHGLRAEASGRVVDAFRDDFRSALGEDGATPARVRAAIQKAVQLAHTRVAAMNNNSYCALALSVVVTHPAEPGEAPARDGYLAGVGDSRGVLYRDGQPVVTTRAENFSAAMFDSGQRDAAFNPMLVNILTNALGSSDFVFGDVLEFPVQPNDQVVVFSDGLGDAFQSRDERAAEAKNYPAKWHGDSAVDAYGVLAALTQGDTGAFADAARLFAGQQYLNGEGKADNRVVVAAAFPGGER